MKMYNLNEEEVKMIEKHRDSIKRKEERGKREHEIIQSALHLMLLAYMKDKNIFDKISSKIKDETDRMNKLEQKRIEIYNRNLQKLLQDYPNLSFSDAVINEDEGALYQMLYHSKGKEVADRLYEGMSTLKDEYPQMINMCCCEEK